jgi:polyphosphate kinase
MSISNYYIDREVSWLNFNRRVLELASLKSIPLFERLRFLSIFCSNLDEYFMKRVGGLKRQIKAGVKNTNSFGRTPEDEILLIRQRLETDLKDLHNIFNNEILVELNNFGFEFKAYSQLTDSEKIKADKYFRDFIFPLLTPLSVDAGHPFPIISNLSENLACALRSKNGELEFARVKVNHLKEQWIDCSTNTTGGRTFISAANLIQQNLKELFPGLEIEATTLFRVTRNAGLEVTIDDDADDLLELVEEELRQRRFSEVVRVEFGNNPNEWLKDFVCENLEVKSYDIYESPSDILSFTSFTSVLERAPRMHLFTPFKPTVPQELLDETDFFSLLKNQDLLVYHPYNSFSSSVEKFLNAATFDPAVRSIKMTLYRIGDANRLIPLLITAAESGKNVVCLVEVKARFDEERNIEWANTMEDAGIHVVYGIPGLKTHAKAMVVIRQETNGLKAFAHIGTGNYNAQTAKLYTDLGLFTADPEITRDLLDFFNYLTGRSLKQDYKKIFIAPAKLEQQILSHIEKEISYAKDGLPAQIIAQLNNLEDPHVIEALYDASNAGVKIDLIIRGICCLVPGIKNKSENIRVRSILGRFLEHSRIFYFRSGAIDELDGNIYISSADWMSRNLHRRVELAVPIQNRNDKKMALNILKELTREDILLWNLENNSNYKINEDFKNELHQILIDTYCNRN